AEQVGELVLEVADGAQRGAERARSPAVGDRERRFRHARIMRDRGYPVRPLKRLVAMLMLVASLGIVPAAAAHVAAVRSGHVVVDGKPFFPIMQWLQCPWLFQPNVAIGVNAFMGKGCQGTTDSQELAGTVAASAWSILPSGASGSGSSLLGWHFSDEPDINNVI